MDELDRELARVARMKMEPKKDVPVFCGRCSMHFTIPLSQDEFVSLARMALHENGAPYMLCSNCAKTLH